MAEISQNTTGTTLTLQNYEIYGQNLDVLLASKPNLQNLVLHLLVDADPELRGTHRDPYLNCETLGKAILLVSKSLEELTLSIEFFSSTAMELDCGGSIDDGADWGTKGVLNVLGYDVFPRLRKLEVPCCVLFGWELGLELKASHLLPRALKWLILRDDLAVWINSPWTSSGIVSWLETFLSDPERGAALPELERVDFYIHDAFHPVDWKKESVARIHQLLEEANLQCTIRLDIDFE